MPKTKKRTLSATQQAKMAVGRANAEAQKAGKPLPFPEVAKEPQALIQQPANQPSPATASALTAQPNPLAGPIADAAPGKAAEPVKYGPHDIVRVFNPDDQPFHFQFGTKAKYDPKGKVIENSIEPIMYTLPAGKAIPMHGYMADYVCNKLTSRILQKRKLVRQLNSPIVRKAWATKIILGKEDIITPEAKLSDAEKVRKEFDKIQAADKSPVADNDNEIPLDEADALLGDMDQETRAANSEFPDADPATATA